MSLHRKETTVAYGMVGLVLSALLWVSCKSPNSHHSATGSSATKGAGSDIGAGSVTSSLERPGCFAESAEIREARDPEVPIAKLIEKLSDLEAYTRLVFAESLASNCHGTEQEDAVVWGIASVVKNRVNDPNQRFGKGKAVVTQLKQFRSTMGAYDVARRMAFLCPERAGVENWDLLWAKASEATGSELAVLKSLSGVVNYYLGEHFRDSTLRGKYYGREPSWANANKRVFPELPGIDRESQCIRFYRN